MIGVWPVFVRELRTLSRQGAFYSVRVGAGLVALCVFSYIWLNLQLPPTKFGAAVFTGMANLLFCAIWIVGPLVSSDCVSSEKREGTLPLLFLTTLKPGEIILAKLGAQLLRTGSLLIAVIPVLVVPILFGGVTWMDVSRAILLNVAALLISLTIGAFASTLTMRRAFGSVLALFLSLGTSLGFVATYLVVRHGFWGWANRSYGESLEAMWAMASRPDAILTAVLRKLSALPMIFASDPYYVQFAVPRSFGRASMTSVQVAGLLLLLAVISIVIVHLVATFQLGRFWRENPGSPAVEKAKRVFFKPVLFESRFRRLRRDRLTKNPIRGVSSLSVANRLHKWWLFLLLMVVVLLDMFPLWGSFRVGVLDDGVDYFRLFLILAIAYVACGSFHNELRSGVLELLIVTPLSPMSIAVGRLLSVAGTFSAVTVCLFALIAYRDSFYARDSFAVWIDAFYELARFGAGAFMMVALGFWASLKRINRFFATFLVGVAGLIGAGGVLGFICSILQVFRYGQEHAWVRELYKLSTTENLLRGFTLDKAAVLFVDFAIPLVVGTLFLRRHCRDLEERRFGPG